MSKASAGGSGAVDEELFIKSFEDVPPVKIFSSRDIQDHIQKTKDVLSDSNCMWEKRIDACKVVRGLLIAGAADYDDFFHSLRMLEPAFIFVIKDLRSQVVREGCITVAYLSQQLGSKFDHFAETVFPSLLNLIPNSAKVMSTSGLVCIRFIIQSVHSNRLIPIICGSSTSKSNIIRRTCLEFVNQLLHSWPTHCLEKHIAILQEAIKRGISDADSEARVHSRKAFWGFADHFKSQADALLNSLDASKQKLLQGEVSNSSSSSSLNGGGDHHQARPRARSRAASEERSGLAGGVSSGYGYSSSVRKMPQRISSSKSDAGDIRIITPRARGVAATTSTTSNGYTSHNPNYNTIGHNHHRTRTTSTSSSKSGVVSSYGTLPRGSSTTTSSSSNYLGAPGLARSSSAADVSSTSLSVGDARRCTTPKPRATILSAARMAKGSANSLPRQRSNTALLSGSPYDQAAMTRTTPRRSSASQSQPNSRSNSPTHSARRQLAYVKNNTPARIDTGLGPRRIRVTGSQSQGASREASPARSFKSSGPERRLSSGGKGSGRKTPVLSQRVLRQGSDVEDALQDALFKGPQRRRYDHYDSDDAASETSSVCSERSHSSYGGRTSEDMHSIITQLGSVSYLDRKDGLLSLQHLLRSHRSLSRVELKKVTEMFTRMFHDPHVKVFCVFLDTLIELVYLQSGDLCDWLHILLPRVLTKAGGELLGSVANKVQKALDVIRDCFPLDHQFNTLSKFVVDQAQGPNYRVRVAMLTYLHSLITVMDPSDFVNTIDARLAITKIIQWTTEPRNADVRKAAQAVLIALFNLNPAEFSILLSELPKTFQDGATRILHSHVRSAGDVHSHMTSSMPSDVLSPRNVASPQGHNRSRPPSRSSQGHPDDFELETENLNPEDIFNSIKQTSADIQSLNKREAYDEVHHHSHQGQGGKQKKPVFTSQDSGIQDLRLDSPDGIDHPQSKRGGYSQFGFHSQKSSSHLGNSGFHGKNGNSESNPEDDSKVIVDILEELSNHNERVEQRKKAMQCLQGLIDKGAITPSLLESYFNNLLLILVETLGDTSGDVKVLALKSMQKMLQKFPRQFEGNAELVILRVLELHKDDTYRDSLNKLVPYAATEVEDTIVQVLPAEQNFRILTPIIQKMEYHMACGAIQMMTKVVEKMPADILEGSLPNLIPGLFKNFEHSESPVRKASCFCLVAIYLRVEEAMRPYMDTLNGHRMKLLNLYIKKRREDDSKA